MIIQAKVTAFFIFIPLLLAAQGSSSCRRSTPANTATPRTNSSVNINKSMNNRSNEPGERMQSGTWGGDHVRIVAGADGAEIEYDCAHGTINAPLELDAEGRFDLRGTHTPEGPGPVRIDKKPPGRPAKYEGRIEGKQMTLTVTLTDTSESVGAFTLTYGSNGRLRKCY